MENNKYRLVTESCYNPFIFECNRMYEGEVNAIHFFKTDDDGNGEIIATAKWFGHLPNGNMKYADISTNNDFKHVDLPYDNIPYRRKVSFDKDKAFYLKVKSDGVTKIELYLNVSELEDFKIKHKDPVTLYHGTERRFCDIVTFKVSGDVKYRRNEKEVEARPIAFFTCNHTREKTEFGKVCQTLSEIISHGSSGVNPVRIAELICNGSIDKFITVYNEWKNATAD